MNLETSYLVNWLTIARPRLPKKNLPWKGRGQGHVSNFFIVDLENFATASRRYTGDIHNSVCSGFLHDTYKTIEATRSRHGWVRMFITHCPTVTVQLHDFDLFRTCRISCFYAVAWQLARFQLTRRIARSLGDSWASCSDRQCIVRMKYMHSATSFRNGLFLYKKESFFLFLQCAREREIYSPQANNQCYKQNELMWQAAR